MGISGGSASGKTSICHKLIESFGVENCVVIPTESFFRDLTKEEVANIDEYNFDHPQAYDFDLMYETIVKLLSGQPTAIPVYDMEECRRSDKSRIVQPNRILILEGQVALYEHRIRDLMEFKIFIQTDDDERLARRIVRDTSERGREVTGVIDEYRKFVKPTYDEFVAPMMRHADLIIPRGTENTIAIDMVTTSVSIHLLG